MVARQTRRAIGPKSGRWRSVYLGLTGSLWAALVVPAIAFGQTLGPDETLALLARGPAKGPESAPVTIIELSDFQCRFCWKFWQETLPSLEAEYVRTGKVRFVYRHLAILGRQSVVAAHAVDCAGEQGKFWEYHDQLFALQGAIPFTTGGLKMHAKDIGLDAEVFGRCVDSGKYLQKVKEETEVGLALGARATPVFLINGMMLVGAHPFETFQQIIENELRVHRESRAPGEEQLPTRGR